MKDLDGKTVDLLPDEYRVKHATGIAADTLGELAGKLDGLDAATFLGPLPEKLRYVSSS